MTEQQVLDELAVLCERIPGDSHLRSFGAYNKTVTFRRGEREELWDVTFYTRTGGVFVQGIGKTLDAAWRQFIVGIADFIRQFPERVVEQRPAVSVLIPGGEDMERFDEAFEGARQ